ncbi:MAG: NUDIX domain-containing protein [Acidimicrobiia bacterium]|nr:NUDIX domain-containing protein [Acidimicrobiia bacterium]
MKRPEVCVGAVAVRDGSLLLVRRGHGPAAGEWSVPGGRVEWGETLAAAVVRETAEETGLDVLCEGFADWVERIGAGHHYVIADFWVSVLSDGPPTAGDDAAEARWVPLEELGGLDLTAGLGDFLVRIGVLDRHA